MMIKLNQKDMARIVPFFEGMEDTLIWSCLQGHMGIAFADNANAPTCAQVITADFAFYAGETSSNEARTLAGHIPEGFPWLICVPSNAAWTALIEKAHEGNYKKIKRYAFKKDPDCFDTHKLKEFARALPEEYEIKQIDGELFNRAKQEPWSQDLCFQFLNADDYMKRGIGFVVLHNGKLVCGASSYTIYDGGIEIEIDTKREYRRQGLARACASALILECLSRGLYPSWDAANLASVGLAQQLGYQLKGAYDAYIIDCAHEKR